MDISSTPKKETSQVELTVTVTAEEFEPYVEAAVKELSKKNPLKGFRPGKVAVPVAVEAYGTDRVVSAALERAVPRLFVQAVLEKEIEALGRPATSIKAASLEGGVEFTALVDVLPEVIVAQPSDIQAERRLVDIGEAEVNKELQYLARMRSTYLDVARAAQKGDTVVVDFDVTMDGAPMEGGSSKQHPVHVGEGHFVPDFEQALIGIQAGDTREFEINFPADYGRESLRGKKAQARVTAHAVQKRVVPQLTDTFAKGLGSFADLADLKAKLKENMQREQIQKEQERVRGELAEKLADASTFSALPASLIEREIDRRLQELQQMLVYQGKTVEQYLVDQKKTLVQLRDELRVPAERTAKVSLALRAFAKAEAIEVTDEEIEARLQQFLSQFKDADEVRNKVDQEELRSNVASAIRNEKALARLEEKAQVVEVAGEHKQAPESAGAS